MTVRKNSAPGLDKVYKPRKLDKRQKKFKEVYLEHGDGVRAYTEAGYPTKDKLGKPVKFLHQRVYSVLNTSSMQHALAIHRTRAIERQQAHEQFSVDWIQRKHYNYADLCEAKGDMGNATRNVEDIGKTVGAYGDGNIHLTVERQFSEQERLEAQRIGELLLLSADAPAMMESEEAVDVEGHEGSPNSLATDD